MTLFLGDSSFPPASFDRSLRERETHPKGLVKKRGPVRALHGATRLVRSAVLYQRVPLNKTRAPVQVQMHVFNLTKLREVLVGEKKKVSRRRVASTGA
jgi:hypothetical protein